ncbi:MAG: hypothetical protein H6712_23805 [Myxococcales bacterium]|nr:hypothetical protein [Myxococcales bacterium]MCB9716904.1 hypothetical protein [Myxococcales bacterium]
MRWLVSILGLSGGMAAGHLGLRWIEEAARRQATAATPAAEHAAVLLTLTGYVLVAAMVAAVLGSLLAWQQRGRYAGTVLLIAGVVPGVFDLRAFVVTCVLILAAMLAYGLSSPVRTWPRRVSSSWS